MQALRLHGYGGNDQLRLDTVPKPECGPAEVLIHVHYAGLNPVDWKFRQGQLRPVMRPALPHIVGNEVAGVVEAVGAEVHGLQVGDRVCARLHKEAMGGFAQWVSTDASLVARVADSVDLATAAGLPLVGLTAWQVLFEYAALQAGQRVLIHAGAGGVGRIVIQLAKQADAVVYTTVSDRGEPVVQALGADQIINYQTTDFTAQARDMDLVVDTVGGDTLRRSFEVVKPGGKVCTLSAVPEPRTADDIDAGAGLKALFWLLSWPWRRRAARHRADYRFLFMRADGAQLQVLCDQLQRGELQADIDRCFPLTDYAEAYAYQESGSAFGKVIFGMQTDD